VKFGAEAPLIHTADDGCAAALYFIKVAALSNVRKLLLTATTWPLAQLAAQDPGGGLTPRHSPSA